MMQNILKTLTFFMVFSAVAQKPISKTVGEFTELKVYDLINVELFKAKENKVEISGKNAENVVIINKDGTLKIRLNLEESFDGDKTNVKLFYTAFDVIDVNEGAYVNSEELINQFEVELRAQEGGLIKLNLETKETKIKAVTGGIVELEGKTQNQNITIGTGGIFKAENLESASSKVAIRAGGEAYINATELLDIKIRAGGDVFIYGNPKEVKENTALGGRIKRMN
ncbi:MAG: head GIN domain-containing protein [Flavobacteriaceae bacterium]